VGGLESFLGTRLATFSGEPMNTFSKTKPARLQPDFIAAHRMPGQVIPPKYDGLFLMHLRSRVGPAPQPSRRFKIPIKFRIASDFHAKVMKITRH
jgi:hypothetical protein